MVRVCFDIHSISDIHGLAFWVVHFITILLSCLTSVLYIHPTCLEKAWFPASLVRRSCLALVPLLLLLLLLLGFGLLLSFLLGERRFLDFMTAPDVDGVAHLLFGLLMQLDFTTSRTLSRVVAAASYLDGVLRLLFRCSLIPRRRGAFVHLHDCSLIHDMAFTLALSLQHSHLRLPPMSAFRLVGQAAQGWLMHDHSHVMRGSIA
jgi:hypothetical protein